MMTIKNVFIHGVTQRVVHWQISGVQAVHVLVTQLKYGIIRLVAVFMAF